MVIFLSGNYLYKHNVNIMSLTYQRKQDFHPVNPLQSEGEGEKKSTTRDYAITSDSQYGWTTLQIIFANLTISIFITI